MASEPIKGIVGGVNPQDYKVVIYARSASRIRLVGWGGVRVQHPDLPIIAHTND